RSIVAGVDTKSEENSDGTVLYHYTPIELFPNIQAEGLRPSGLGPGGRDAIHGIGQYFTDISPQEAASVKRGEFMYALYQDARRHGFTKPIGWIQVTFSSRLIQSGTIRRVSDVYGQHFPGRGFW